VTVQERLFELAKGVESLSKEEHGLFFDAVQRLELPNEVKQAAVVLYLDFKKRPAGKYNTDRKNLEIFQIASVSLAAKAVGELRTDQEFESKLFVSKEKLADAEDRILMSFAVHDTVMPFPNLLLQLTRRQIVSMAEGFAERELVSGDQKEELVQRSNSYLDMAIERGLNPKMSYRGRAAGVVLKAVRDLGLKIPEGDIARAAGFHKWSMAIDARAIDSLLNDSKSQ
jgi:hypothetical protein